MKPKPKVMPWETKLWGVMLLPSRHDVGNVLIANRDWRPLLFSSRYECREWIRRQHMRFSGERYRCVRVRERVEVCDESQ